MVAALGFPTTQAFAQDVAGGTDDQARAKQLFDAAMEDAKREDYAAACPKFRASYQINKKASTLLNLGTCYERNGQTASAWGAFTEAAIAAKKVARDDWAAQAEERIRILEPRLAKVVVRTTAGSQPDGWVLRRDSVTLTEGELNLPMAMDPGEHTLTATAPGYIAWSTKFQVTEGVKEPLELTVPALIAEPKAPALPPPRYAMPVPAPYFTPMRVSGIAVGAVGVVGLGVGAVLAGLANARYTDSRRQCPEVDCSNTGALSDNRAAFDLATGSTVAVVVGAVLTLGGAALFLFAPDSSPRAAAGAPTRVTAGTLRWSITPEINRADHGATFRLGGTF
jgi:hypothetical protein